MFFLNQPIKEWLPTWWYPGYMEGLPDMLVGRWPREFGFQGDDRWKVWIVETPKEREALLSALSKPVPRRGDAIDFQTGPDAAVSKVDRTRNYGEAGSALYPPPDDATGWPFITLFRFPSVAAAGSTSAQLARGVYAVEFDMTEDMAMTRMARLYGLMGGSSKLAFPDRRLTC